MKKDIIVNLLLISCLIFSSSCDDSDPNQTTEIQEVKSRRDIPVFTKHEGVLTVLMDNSLTSYFIFQGHAMGFEYEMLELFSKENKLKLNIKIIDNVEGILDSLLAGNGDLVAANLTISKDRMGQVNFTKQLFRTKQILVQRLPDEKQK